MAVQEWPQASPLAELCRITADQMRLPNELDVRLNFRRDVIDTTGMRLELTQGIRSDRLPRWA